MRTTHAQNLDRRSHDLITIDREAYLDAEYGLLCLNRQLRVEIARAYLARRKCESPLTHLAAADRLAERIIEYARRRAAETSGITYISRDQLPIWEDPSLGRWVRYHAGAAGDLPDAQQP